MEKNTYRHSSPFNVNRNPYKSVLRVCWASLFGNQEYHFELPSWKIYCLQLVLARDIRVLATSSNIMEAEGSGGNISFRRCVVDLECW